MIAIAQKVEHYEIAGYGSTRTHAQMMANHEAADLLDETLEEEKAANQRLNELARSVINDRAFSASKKTRTAGGAGRR
jgi:ferritin-like metal-binding protein YciE